MSMYLNTIKVELTADMSPAGRELWRVLEDFVYVSDLVGVVVIPKDFMTDFASVPRLPFVFLLTGNTAHRAALVHDYLYTTNEYSRQLSDEVFKEAIVAAGEPSWRASLMYAGVRIGGQGSWESAGPRQTEAVKQFMNKE
jgi:hypothetical protein